MLFAYMQSLFQDMGANPRERNSDTSSVMSYEITDIKQVKIILQLLMPFLVIKRKQAKYCLDIIEQYDEALGDPKLFIQLCRKADRIASLNDSKNRKNTHIKVIEHLRKKKLI